MMDMFIKEVARGKRGARDLTSEEALRAAEQIVFGQASDAQIGAFLTAERMKMESVDELLAFIDQFRSLSTIHPIEGSIDCSGPYDGRNRSFYSSFATAFVLSSFGIPVTLHSSPTLPPKQGITLYDMLQTIHISLDHKEQKTIIHAAKKSGVFILPTEQWCPPLQRLRPIRQQLGMRTMLNTIEKLLRFSESPYMAIGIYHGTIMNKMTEVLKKSGVKRGMIVQGMEGSEDLPIDRRSRVYVFNEIYEEWNVIDPHLYELSATYPEMKWTAKRQMDVSLSVLKGTADLAFYHTVILNAGVRLWISGKTPSIEEGIYEANYAIDSGRAFNQFQLWKESMHQSVAI
ncbi:anthranilate phosphoribosyltransferase [Halalkalibacter hemicellulosilyticus]|uniref:Anthranilate phosphoribosyltransferase n=1 Tax=Halalkalibacter hemicellulosilyticusJCM 9152 TaxID=1236971 RepID=W4QE80_9BACI|nr:hypothetical protein [Halalkalibacter hemicellulosilyticus]GAE29963.1 anthranilate phosphoribosyltransferase [Halalkalibacter hemicellulosilyticusJCM 9152]